MDGLIALAQYCIGAPLSAPVCKPFWSWVLLAVLGATVLVLFFFVRVIVRDIRRRRAADAEEARRAYVDVEAINAAKWNGEQLAGDPHLNPDLAGAIRAHVRAQVESSPPLPIIDIPDGNHRS
jgi:flagellar biosynthesis/type III secretory pathway M-ring protein FliF/YscJ